jgi:chromosome segregation ATPase
MIRAHETRLQRVEEFIAEVSGSMGKLTEHIEGVSQRLDDIVSRIGEVHTQVEELKRQQDEQKRQLDALIADRQRAQDRLKLAKKAGVGVLLTMLGALATRWGETLYDWLFGPRAPGP